MQGLIAGPWVCDLSRRQMFNQMSHSGALQDDVHQVPNVIYTEQSSRWVLKNKSRDLKILLSTHVKIAGHLNSIIFTIRVNNTTMPAPKNPTVALPHHILFPFF